MRLVGVFTVADAIPYLRWFDFGGHEKAMKENIKQLDIVVSEQLEKHRQKRGSGEKIKSDRLHGCDAFDDRWNNDSWA